MEMKISVDEQKEINSLNNKNKNNVKKKELLSKCRRSLRTRKEYICFKCKFRTFEKYKLDNHLLDHLDKPIKCFVCKNKFNSKVGLQDHVLKHFKQLTKCKGWNCGFETNKRQTMLHHLKKKCKKTVFECAFCDYETVCEFKLKSHICRKTTEKRSYKCYFCKHQYTSRDKFRFHLVKHFNKPQFIVYICNSKKKKSIKFQTALQVKKKMGLFFICTNCNFLTKCKNILKKHVLKHKLQINLHKRSDDASSHSNHIPTKEANEEPLHNNILNSKHKCLKCNNEYDDKESFDHHLTIYSCIKLELDDNSMKDDGQYKCLKCNYTTLIEEDLTKHATTHKDLVHKCLECNIEYENELSLVIHLRTHSSTPFLCSVCGNKFSVEKDFGHHIRKHKEKIFRCSQCKYNCVDKKSFEEHLLIHYQAESFECPECSFLASVESHLKDHIKIHLYQCNACDFKSITPMGKRVNHPCLKKCSNCEYKNSNSSKLIRHMKSWHPELFKYKCSYCVFVTNEKKNYNIHVSNHSQEYICPYCNTELLFKKLVGQFKHTTKYILTCNKCNCEFGYNKFVKNLSNKRKSTKHNCSNCNFECHSKRTLRNHIAKHTGEFSFICKQCEFKTCDKSHFKKHLETHSKTKRFICSQCNFSAKTKVSLSNHLIVHRAKKLYSCDKCDYESNYKHNLQNHILKHSTERLLSCNHCDFTSNYKYCIERHIQIAHEREAMNEVVLQETVNEISKFLETEPKEIEVSITKKLYECPICDYTTFYIGNLRVHKQTIHSEANETFSCPHCKFSTKSKNSLELHSVYHLDETELKCFYCDLISESKTVLRQHILGHQKEKEEKEKSNKESKPAQKVFKCDCCPYSSYSRVGYNQHKKTHLKVKGLKCPTCQYATNFKGNLTKHMKLKHSEK